jgi:putative tricarboxylic transport membrane protein
MEDNAATPRGPSTRTMDVIVGACLLVLGLLIMADNYRIGAGWAPDGPRAGYFPLRLGLLITLCSAVVIWRALHNKTDRSLFVEWVKLIPVAQVLVPLIVYITAMQYLGMYVASTLFVAGFMHWLGKYSWLKSFVVALIMSVLLFWLFELQFLVPLPKGPLEQMLGY